MLKIKICCIKSIEEARLALQLGATEIGLVGHMPSGPGVIADDDIAEIVKALPASISTFLLTSETDAEKIVSQHKKVNTSTIQLVDKLKDDNYAMIRAELPDVQLVQVVHVLDRGAIREAIRVSRFVDTILLDSGNPKLTVKELGGTGRTHNWAISKRIIEVVSVPVFLAGGINKDNVTDAISQVQPYGIDLCSGVRTDDILDEKKLRAFFRKLE